MLGLLIHGAWLDLVVLLLLYDIASVDDGSLQASDSLLIDCEYFNN